MSFFFLPIKGEFFIFCKFLSTSFKARTLHPVLLRLTRDFEKRKNPAAQLIHETQHKVFALLLTCCVFCPSGRKSLCLRSSRWNSPETTATWPRAATLTALRSSRPPWSTMSGRRTPVRTTVRPWPPLEWAWRWLRAGRRPSDRP